MGAECRSHIPMFRIINYSHVPNHQRGPMRSQRECGPRPTNDAADVRKRNNAEAEQLTWWKRFHHGGKLKEKKTYSSIAESMKAVPF